MSKKATVVSGFPGVGKSTLFDSDSGLIVLDSDSSNFSWLNQAEKIRHPQWPHNYILHIQENLDACDIICVSSHDVVREELVKAVIEFVLVYPGLDMKEEYIQRYVQRGNLEGFIKLLQENYENWITELELQGLCTHVVLKPGEYLSDVLDQIL